MLTLWVIAAVGLVVAWHQPRNAIGWLMLGAPVVLLLTLASQVYVHKAYRAGGHALPVVGPAALIFAQQFFVFFVAFPLIILLFPDGRLPSSRWRWALWLYLALSLSAPLAELGVTIDVMVGHAIHVLPDNQLAAGGEPVRRPGLDEGRGRPVPRSGWPPAGWPPCHARCSAGGGPPGNAASS